MTPSLFMTRKTMQQAHRLFMMTAASLAVLAGVAIHQSSEIDAGVYRVLRDDFKRGTPEYRSAIAAAMHSGEISRWEYRNLLVLSRQENRANVIDGEALNLREERLVLAAMTRQIKAP
jgi:hypothetical protein